MIKKYTIAKFNISVDVEHDDYFFSRLSSYESSFDAEPDITFSLRRTKLLIKPSYTHLVKIGQDKYTCKINGDDALINFDSNTGKIIALTKFDKSYSHIDIISYDITQDYDYSCSHFNFNLVGNAMHYVMAMHSGFVFHASSLVCDDGAVLFSAPSGTGKTTHTSLWLEQFEDVRILNDDTPIIRVESDGKVSAFGTPWAGTSGININESAPLKAIVFLERSKENSITRLSSQEALKRFFEAITSSLNPTMQLSFLDTIKSIFASVPIYKLSCNMEPEAAELARNHIFNSTK